MNTKWILKTTGLLIVMASLFVISSCSKTANGILTRDQLVQQDTSSATPIDEKNITETDEDLTTVDYKEFYDQLAPHGQWIQVPLSELGLKSKTASIESSSKNSSLLSKLFGINDANASSLVADVGMAFVWQPSPDLTIAGTVGGDEGYRPYRNGQWENTNEGWYFRSPTPWEETVHHHGRWMHSHDNGWLWIPGRVWAPAWVDWRQNDDYESWAPLPPSIYLTVGGGMDNPYIDDDDYMIVERRHFIDPDIYMYDHPYYDNGDRIYASGLSGTIGIVIVNNVIINRGPDVNIIQNVYGRHIDMINIRHTRNFDEARYSDKEYNCYTPSFKRYNDKGHKEFSKNEPKSVKNYSDARKVNKGNDNGNKQKNNDKGTKQKGNDNGNKQKSNDKGNKQKSYDNGNKQKNNDNVKTPPKGNDNGSKQKGNDNGSKQKGNDNGSKQKGNDNGSKQKGNDNGKGKK